MEIRMLKAARGMVDGKVVWFEVGRVYSVKDRTINDRLANAFVRDGLAKEIADAEPAPKKKAAQSKAEYK
jgi:hypothetical protein